MSDFSPVQLGVTSTFTVADALVLVVAIALFVRLMSAIKPRHHRRRVRKYRDRCGPQEPLEISHRRGRADTDLPDAIG